MTTGAKQAETDPEAKKGSQQVDQPESQEVNYQPSSGDTDTTPFESFCDFTQEEEED